MLSALGPSALVPTALGQTRFITRQGDEYPTFILVRVMMMMMMNMNMNNINMNMNMNMNMKLTHFFDAKSYIGSAPIWVMNYSIQHSMRVLNLGFSTHMGDES